MTDKYFITKKCKNCKAENKLTIPKGTTIKDFIKEHKGCWKCGCKLGVEE
jgi:hypothetical protein